MQITLLPFSGKSKKTGKEYNCFRLTVGEWSQFIFPRTNFEREYLEKIIGEGVAIEVDDESR